eukprot:NODE_1670_length_1338_cov_4.335144_g1385_i0.p1 GENE.NODE_1670_length_1338_cov_4.335144_g1385_i0~~NODE_1670_length_1338_cov_4.335144_g1385_i0.p1  ORF type:complete len:315 (+),score=149.88 NODE_1670_length_1338_cov_4.335144_g1385_i0:25-969(+)
MNTGAEAVEAGIKLARKWGYLKKGIEKNKALIVVCNDNFHGRTTAIISFSTDPVAVDNYGPYLPGFLHVDFNDAAALEKVFEEHGKNIAGFMVEPIQGEAGVVVPDEGYLAKARAICDKHNALLIADEVQTGIARTGKLLAHYYDEIRPDIILMAKALGGGLYPVSAVMADDTVMEVIKPGTHGSTFGGNPLASVVAMEALQVVFDEDLVTRSFEQGKKFRAALEDLVKPYSTEVKCVRGRGLLNAIELDPKLDDGHLAYRLTIKMRDNGLLAKPTHGNIIRFSPPLTINDEELKICLGIIEKSLPQAFSEYKK